MERAVEQKDIKSEVSTALCLLQGRPTPQYLTLTRLTRILVDLPSMFNLLKPKTYFMYRQFNVQQFYVLPTQTVFMCFVWL